MNNNVCATASAAKPPLTYKAVPLLDGRYKLTFLDYQHSLGSGTLFTHGNITIASGADSATRVGSVLFVQGSNFDPDDPFDMIVEAFEFVDIKAALDAFKALDVTTDAERSYLPHYVVVHRSSLYTIVSATRCVSYEKNLYEREDVELLCNRFNRRLNNKKALRKITIQVERGARRAYIGGRNPGMWSLAVNQNYGLPDNRAEVFFDNCVELLEKFLEIIPDDELKAQYVLTVDSAKAEEGDA